MGWRDWIGGHGDEEYDRDYSGYDRDFRYGYRGGEQVYRRQAGSSGSPAQRWWATERYAPSGRPGREDYGPRGYGAEYGRRPRLSAGGRQGPGRAWGMGGNIEMESENYAPRGGYDEPAWSGYGVPRTPGAGGNRGHHFSFGMGARTDMEGLRGNEFDVDLGPLPMDSLRRGSPRGGQQRAGRYYGHEHDYGGRFLRGDTYRAYAPDEDFGDVDDYDGNYARGHVSYGNEYSEHGRGASGARRQGQNAAEYGSGQYRGHPNRPPTGPSPMRPWNDETRGGTGRGTGYRRR